MYHTIRGLFALVLILIAAAAHAGTAVSDAAVARSLRDHFTTTAAAAPATRVRQLTLARSVAEFYAARDYAPAWRNGHLVAQLFRELDNLRDDGLNPEDYHLSELHLAYAHMQGVDADADRIAAFDLLASSAYLRSLAHLFRGKVNPATLDPQWNVSLNDMAAADAITIVNTGIERGDIHPVYERARPQHPLYLRARNALARLRVIAAHGGWQRLTTTAVLKPGMVDPNIGKLRERFLPDSASGLQAFVYDDALVAKIRQFQREQSLGADGVIGPETRAALNVPVRTRIDQLRVNLERGRWLFHELQGDFVLVDIAGFRIHFFRDSSQIWQSRVQVGKPYRQTPAFKSKITYVTFNPTWTVPPTILKKDILPKLKKGDLAFLTENHIRVLDGSGHQLDPKTIDWSNPGNLTLRQDAGADAALGQVAIRFPNPYSIYLHDTPHRELFNSTRRAFSSGCIRVQHPLELVALLFNDPEKWSDQAIAQFIAQGETRNVTLPKPVPILLAYWTIDLFNDGDVGFRPDIYERDPAVLKALNAKL